MYYVSKPCVSLIHITTTVVCCGKLILLFNLPDCQTSNRKAQLSFEYSNGNNMIKLFYGCVPYVTNFHLRMQIIILFNTFNLARK